MLPKPTEAGAAGVDDPPKAGAKPFDCGCEPKRPALKAGLDSSCVFGCPNTLLLPPNPVLDDWPKLKPFVLAEGAG